MGNKFLQQLIGRLENDDPSMTNLSLKRLPIFELSANEILQILEPIRSKTSQVKSIDFWLPAVADFDRVTSILQENQSIESLEITSCGSQESLNAILEGLSASTTLRNIIIGDAVLSSSDDEVFKMGTQSCTLLKDIIRKECVEELTIKGCSIPAESAELLADGLSKSSLSTLVLHQIESDPGSFGRILASCINVERVLIIDCDLSLDGPLDGHPVTDLLRGNEVLKELRLLECDLCEKSFVVFQAIEEGLKDNSCLEILDLRSNLIGDEACQSLMRAIGRSLSLKKLILEDNLIGNNGLETLSLGLASNTTLKKLNLRSNLFTDCSALLQATSLEELDVSETRMTDTIGLPLLVKQAQSLRCLKAEGCQMGTTSLLLICSALQQSFLSAISLAHNTMPLEVSRRLAQSLRSNERLRTLDLTSCSLSDDAVAFISRALTHNTSLRDLRIGFNKISDKGCAYIGRNLPKINLRSIEIQFNAFSTRGLASIVEGMERNTSLLSIFALDYGAYTEEKVQLVRRISQILLLNKGGRRALQEDVSAAVFPLVLEKSSSRLMRDALYHLLTSRPDIVGSKS